MFATQLLTYPDRIFWSFLGILKPLRDKLQEKDIFNTWMLKEQDLIQASVCEAPTVPNTPHVTPQSSVSRPPPPANNDTDPLIEPLLALPVSAVYSAQASSAPVSAPPISTRLHSAAVRLALLFGNQEVGHTELVVAQLTTEGPKSLDIPVTVGFSNFEELGDEVFGKGDSPQFNLFSIFISEGRFLLTRYGIRTIHLSLLFTKSACWKL